MKYCGTGFNCVVSLLIFFNVNYIFNNSIIASALFQQNSPAYFSLRLLKTMASQRADGVCMLESAVQSHCEYKCIRTPHVYL